MHTLKLFAAALVAAAGLALPARATVTTTCTNESYTGNGATVDFSFPCKFLDNSHLVVKVNSVTQLLTTNYTVTGAGTSSGNVHFLTAPANALSVTIQRVTPKTQSTSLNQSRNLNPAAIEAMADRDILIAQELNDGALSQNSVALTGNVTAQQYNRRCMVDQYSGADIGIKLAAAIADSNCTAKIFDMTGMGSGTQTLSGNVSLSIAGAKYLWPNARINMGSNQIIVPVGVHDVSMFGVSSSASDSGLGQKATYFNYTGNAAAIVVGDASANTFAFHAGLFAVNLSGAGANAIGIQLNRAIDYTLEPVRVGTNAFATTYGIDLEGSGNYTGGTMIHPWISYVDGEAIHFGTNANANTIIGAHLEGGGAGHGIGFNFAGTAGGNADGNLILGGDSENCNVSLNYDRANNNAVFGLRTEGCTTAANTTANAQQNHAFTTGSNSMAVNDIGSNNSFTDAYWTQLGRSTWKMKSGADVSSLLVMNSGLTIEQIAEIQLLGLTDGWKITKDNAAGFKISHNASTPAGINHLHFTSNSFINSESAGAVLVNDEANTGTGGFQVWSGGAGPVLSWSAAADGLVTMRAKLQAALGTPANGTMYYCSDCNTASAPCTGGGTGALAFRQNGAWKCF